MMALEYRDASIIRLKCRAVPLLKGTSRHKMSRGAYVLLGSPNAYLTLISTRGDLYRVVDAARILNEAHMPTRVVSMPSIGCFQQQSTHYIRSVVPWDGRLVVSIEAMSTHGWARWSMASIGMDRFGTTVHADAVTPRFKMTPEDLVKRIQRYLTDLDSQHAQMAGWRTI